MSLGGGEGLTIGAGAIAASMLPIDISADLIDELTLPPDMLPSSAGRPLHVCRDSFVCVP